MTLAELILAALAGNLLAFLVYRLRARKRPGTLCEIVGHSYEVFGADWTIPRRRVERCLRCGAGSEDPGPWFASIDTIRTGATWQPVMGAGMDPGHAVETALAAACFPTVERIRRIDLVRGSSMVTFDEEQVAQLQASDEGLIEGIRKAVER